MFFYTQDDRSFYKYLTEYGSTFTKLFIFMIQGWHESKTIPPGYFVLSSESNFAHISNARSLNDGNMNLGGRNKSFLIVPNFPQDNYLHYKLYFKKIIFLLVGFGISQFATDSPWENFLVYILLMRFEPGSF